MVSSSFRAVLFCGLLAATPISVRAAEMDKPRLDSHGDPLPPEALQRLGSARFRAETNYGGATLSPDGSTIALLGRDGIVLLDAASGKEVQRFVQRFIGPPGTLTYSPDGKKIAWSGIQGVQLLDVQSGKLLGRMTDQAERLSFSADGSRVAIGPDQDGRKLTASICDTTTFKKLQTVELLQDSSGGGVALSGDGKRLATWSSCIDGAANKAARTVQVWEAATGKEIQKIALDGVQVSTAALSGDGKHLAAVAESGKAVTIWDVDSGKSLHSLETQGNPEALLRYSSDGKLLVAATKDGALQLWETPEYKRLGGVSGLKSFVCSVAFLPEKKVRALSRSGLALHLWEAPSDRRPAQEEGHQEAVQSLCFRRDGKEIVSAAADGVRVWDLTTGKAKQRPNLHDTDTEVKGVFGPICLAPNGRLAAVGSYYARSWRVVDLDNGKELIRLESKGSDFPNPLTAFSADSDTAVLTLPAPKDGHRGFAVRVWDLRTGREKNQWNVQLSDEYANDLFTCALSPDGRFVLTAINMPPRKATLRPYVELALWDAATGKARWQATCEDQWAHQFAFSPDGNLIATAGSVTSTVYLFDAATGVEWRRLESVEGVQASCLQFSPDGRSLAVGGSRQLKNRAVEGAVCLWETATGKPRLTLAGQRADIRALAFSQDGRTLASGASDTTILLWDLTGKLDAAVQKQEKPKPAEFDALWDELADADATKAYRLLQHLAAHPAEATALVKAKLPAATGKPLDAAAVEKQSADLDHEDFDRREAASKALAAAGQPASAALRKALRAAPSVEKKRRIEALLAALKNPSPEMLRATRALELLERVGTPDAKQVLEELAKGNPDASLTQDAKATLKRLLVQ
jgi:WD40 repeat protein